MDEKLKEAMKKALAEGRTMTETTPTGWEIEYFEDEETGLWYPMFALEEEVEVEPSQVPYGMMWKEYLLENKRHEITTLVMTGELNKRMLEIQEMAENYKEKMIQELLEKQPMPPSDKTLERANHLTQIHQMAEEMTIKDIIEKVV
ncbi:TnpV protein [uncultured Tyzzerella sp.]|uniref:TnpV protein n=1 Tax=uncultured Tyzzerella sp. TaxID=2321398 RepID=UPI0034DD1755